MVVTPSRRDAEATCRFLEAAGIACTTVHSPVEAEAAVRSGIGALLLTDFVLADPASAGLLRTLQEQPAWSNLPVLVVSGAGLSVADLPAGLGNFTVLDRPTSGRAVVSAVQSALRGRRWQYQIRDQIAELTAVERALRLADQHKDTFLATLAHELRNPLAPIRTGVQILRSENIDRAQLERVRAMIERQVAHLVRLIDELLDVSRMTTGKVVLQRATMDLRGAVQNAIEGAQPAIVAAGHRFEARLPPAPVWVLGDATRLAQSVGNLIHNAVKYTRDGGHIEVELQSGADEARVVVRDDGLGIPPEMQARVFDMFTQVDRTLQRAQGGLGIGLSLVKNLVELHGGRVGVHSDGDDRGSTFTIALPLAGAGGARGAPDGGEAPALPAAAQPLRVMVVDDNRDAADSLAMLLESIGHCAAVHYDGAEALAAASRLRPDAVLCDLGMPGMGGLEFASRLRDDRGLDRTLLVAVTGWGAEHDRQRSRRAGFDVHLTKPVSLDRLAELLANGRPAP